MKKKRKVITISFDPDFLGKIKNIAKKHDVSVAGFIRLVISEKIKKEDNNDRK